MIVDALVERLKHWSKDNPKGRCHKGYNPTVTPPCYAGVGHNRIEFGIL